LAVDAQFDAVFLRLGHPELGKQFCVAIEHLGPAKDRAKDRAKEPVVLEIVLELDAPRLTSSVLS
jgi:hypothetical protein